MRQSLNLPFYEEQVDLILFWFLSDHGFENPVFQRHIQMKLMLLQYPSGNGDTGSRSEFILISLVPDRDSLASNINLDLRISAFLYRRGSLKAR